MIKIYGEGRGIRVVWLCEELGLDYDFVEIDLRSSGPHDADFMAINPSIFIPALRDGDVTMIESIAILEYLAARHGGGAMAPGPEAESFPLYKQFLLMGEAGLASATFYYQNLSHLGAGESAVAFARRQFESRLALVQRQIELSPFIAGDSFTLADISVVYGLNHGQFMSGLPMPGPVAAYLQRLRARPAYLRMLDACPGTRDFYRSREAEAEAAARG